MTRNQKIALGCGGAGCLGLLVVAIAAGLFFFFYSSQRARYERASRDYNFNVNLNSNSNSNDDANDNSFNSNSDSSSSSSSSASSMSEDDKHKLYYAATVTGNSDVVNRVSVKIGITNEDGTLAEGYQKFMAEHGAWAFRNLSFLREVGTPEKAQAYVDEHLE